MQSLQWKTLHSVTCIEIQKYKKKENSELTDTKENKPEEVKCTSTNTGQSYVISICIVPIQIKSKDTNKSVHTSAFLDSCSQSTFILGQQINNLGMAEKKKSHLQ